MLEVKVGDWVSAETDAGDVYRGWVTNKVGVKVSVKISEFGATFMPLVFTVDQVAVCPVYVNADEVDSLIDLALFLKDKKWFEELMAEKTHLYRTYNREAYNG
ncbi:hypothetical protein D3C79_806720 [compost metagenome]